MLSWKVTITLLLILGVLLFLLPSHHNTFLQIASNLIFLGPEKAIVHAFALAREIYDEVVTDVQHQHRMEVILEHILRSGECLNMPNYYSPDLYEVLAKTASKKRVLFVIGPHGSFRYSTVKYFLCDTKKYEIFIDFDAAPSEGTEFIKYFKHIIGDHPDINKSKEAAFLDVLSHLEEAVKLQKLKDPQFHPYLVFRGIDNLAKIDSVCLHHLMDWSTSPIIQSLAHVVFISSANILLGDVIGTVRLMHRTFLLASVGYANDTQTNQFFEEQLIKHNKTVTKEEQEKILKVTGGSMNDILLFFNYFSTRSVAENGLNEMLKIARFRVSTMLLGLKGPTCNVSSQVTKSVVHSLGCSSGYLLYEKMLDIVSLEDLKCLITENFLVLRSNIDEANEPIGVYVSSISPLYSSIFQEIVNKDPQTSCKPAATCKELSCSGENDKLQ